MHSKEKQLRKPQLQMTAQISLQGGKPNRGLKIYPLVSANQPLKNNNLNNNNNNNKNNNNNNLMLILCISISEILNANYNTEHKSPINYSSIKCGS